MTTRTILFDSPFLLGFDHTRALIDRAARAAADSYPPYNVEQRGERSVRITLAVAGFGPDDLAVTLEGRQLTIQGKREPADWWQRFWATQEAATGKTRDELMRDLERLLGRRPQPHELEDAIRRVFKS